MKPAEFAAFIKKDIVRWTALAKARNIQFNFALRPFVVTQHLYLGECKPTCDVACAGIQAVSAKIWICINLSGAAVTKRANACTQHEAASLI
jgi:hypothetical protein